MINLLPPQKKEELKQEETLKTVLILGTLFLAALFCFVLILFSIKVFVSGEAGVQKILYLQREKDFNASHLQILQEKITQANEKIDQLDSFYKKQFHFTKAFEVISKNVPSGIYLTSLSVYPQLESRAVAKGEEEDLSSSPTRATAKGEEEDLSSSPSGGAVVNLLGFSPTRDLLLQLKANLEKEESFYEINFPSSNWVKSESINFLVSFKTR